MASASAYAELRYVQLAIEVRYGQLGNYSLTPTENRTAANWYAPVSFMISSPDSGIYFFLMNGTKPMDYDKGSKQRKSAKPK
jgi:hypothetical protein